MKRWEFEQRDGIHTEASFCFTDVIAPVRLLVVEMRVVGAELCTVGCAK